MASFSFEVVHAFIINEYRGVVIARQLDPGAFALGPQSTLGGCALEPRFELEVPRGGPPDSFMFYLDSFEDLAEFIPGQRVTLDHVVVAKTPAEPPV
jgi:hypothetical protein